MKWFWFHNTETASFTTWTRVPMSSTNQTPQQQHNWSVEWLTECNRCPSMSLCSKKMPKQNWKGERWCHCEILRFSWFPVFDLEFRHWLHGRWQAPTSRNLWISTHDFPHFPKTFKRKLGNRGWKFMNVRKLPRPPFTTCGGMKMMFLWLFLTKTHQKKMNGW
jgi:hypothetical protein